MTDDEVDSIRSRLPRYAILSDDPIVYARECIRAGIAASEARLLPVLADCEERIREWCNYCGGNRATCDNAPGSCPARAARAAGKRHDDR